MYMAEKENIPPVKKHRLSLSLKSRYRNATCVELEDLSKVKMLKNTSLSTRWAMKNFTDWFSGYNTRNPDNPCPDEVLLPSCPAEVLSKWLCVYVAETRSHTEEAYPPTTVYSLLSGVLRYMKSENPISWIRTILLSPPVICTIVNIFFWCSLLDSIIISNFF